MEHPGRRASPRRARADNPSAVELTSDQTNVPYVPSQVSQGVKEHDAIPQLTDSGAVCGRDADRNRATNTKYTQDRLPIQLRRAERSGQRVLECPTRPGLYRRS